MSTHYVLKIQYVNKPPETRNISARVTTIGREAGDIILGDPQSSGRHAEIYFENGNVRVKDLGSTNGTFYNGQRAPEFTLEAGQGFSIGQTVMTLMAIPGAQARAGAGKTMIAMGGMPRPPGPPGAPPPPPGGGFGAPPPPPGGGFGAPPPAPAGFGAPPPAPPQASFGGPPPGAPPGPGGFGAPPGPPPGAPPGPGGFGAPPGPPPGAPPPGPGGFGAPPPQQGFGAPPPGPGGFGAPPPGGPGPGGFGAPPPQQPGFGGPPPGGPPPGGFGAPPPGAPPPGPGPMMMAPAPASSFGAPPPPSAPPMQMGQAGGEIRGDFSGTGGELLGQLVIGAILTAITFGFYAPWFICKAANFIAQRVTFGPTSKGTVQFRFDGKGGQFFVTYLLGAFLTAITFGIYAPWFICNLTKFFTENTTITTSDGTTYNLRFNGTGGELLVTFLVGALLCMVTLYIYMPWFMCKMNRWFAERTKIVSNGQEVGSLEFTGEGGTLLKTFIVGVLLCIVTLYIYMPWFQVKMIKFNADNLKVTLHGRRYSMRFTGEGGELFVIMLVGVLLGMITFGIYYFWMLAKLLKWELSNLVLTAEGGAAIGAGAPAGGFVQQAPPPGQMPYGAPPQPQLGAGNPYGQPQPGYGAPPPGGYGPPPGGGYGPPPGGGYGPPPGGGYA